MAALCSPSKHLAPSRSTIEAPPSCKALRMAPTVTCTSAAASTQAATGRLSQKSGALQCPSAPPLPRTYEGDWNSRMLFNRGLETVKDVDKDSLFSELRAAGDKPIVLDMYSRWCGPCRLIYPKLVKLAGKYTDVVFLKLDCSAENKTIFSKLGIGILPTFKIFKGNNLISEVKGAKYDELVTEIEKARST